ncbi:MAG: efflux RND transporter periplasmic adaptor subunit [Akkermansiaceae bacterium]
MRHLLHIIIAICVLGVGIFAYSSLKGCKKVPFRKEDETSKKASAQGGKGGGKGSKGGMPSRPMIRTRAMELEKQDFTVKIHSQGEIRPHHTTSLTPEVSGKIVRLAPGFEDGSFFSKGDILLEIENTDFLTEIEAAKAQLARAEATHAQEKARAKQALLNWKDAGFNEEPSDLVLRKPQLREAEANVKSAKSSLERAERNLARTKVRAPYNGRVRKRNVGLGQRIGSGTTLGEIFTTDIAEVRLPLTPRDLLFYQPPNKPAQLTKQTDVTFTSILSNNDESTTWKGKITRTEGELDADSRQIFIIARITDPFGLHSKHPALFIGQPVRATIPAKTIKDVYAIPRDALSDLNEIIVIREGKIKHLDIEPLWSTSDFIIIRDGILPGDLLATTRIPVAPEGAPIEIIPEEKPKEIEDKKQPCDSRRVGRKGPRKGASK